MSTGTTVTFGTISQAQSDVSNTSARMDGQLNDLRSYLAPMVGAWSGGASDDYKVLQQRWDGAAADLNAVLMQISQLLGQANQGYQATEQANASVWM